MAKQTKTQRFLAAREKGANSTIPFERRFWNIEDLREFKSAAKHGLDKYYCLREQALKGRDTQWHGGEMYFKTIQQYDLYISIITAACEFIGYELEMYNGCYFWLKAKQTGEKHEIEEGSIVEVKSEGLEAQVLRVVADNVVVEFTNRRPEGGDKRRNYKKRDLKVLTC